MPVLYRVVGGYHHDADATRHAPGDIYSPTDQELAAFPDRFELIATQEMLAEAATEGVLDDLRSIPEISKPVEEIMDHLDKVATFIANTNPGVVLKAIADGRFTAEDALACEMAATVVRPLLVATLELIAEGKIKPHPDNVLTLEDLEKLEDTEKDRGALATFHVTKASIEEVLARVKAGELSADVALAQERGREKPRKGLLTKLEAMVE